MVVVFRLDILLQSMTASSNKGSQVVLVLPGMIGVLLITILVAAAFFLLVERRKAVENLYSERICNF